MHVAAERAPANVQIERSDGTREYSISVDKDDVTVNAPLPKGNRRADACGELYAKARGTIAAAYGEPRDETEQAMDALTGSIVTARGTNGCGLGGVPPEPDRLRAAVVELQQDPSRLADIRTQVDRRREGALPAVAGPRNGTGGRTRRRERANRHLRLRRRGAADAYSGGQRA